jgi:hypothetical protein
LEQDSRSSYNIYDYLKEKKKEDHIREMNSQFLDDNEETNDMKKLISELSISSNEKYWQREQ